MHRLILLWLAGLTIFVVVATLASWWLIDQSDLSKVIMSRVSGGQMELTGQEKSEGETSKEQLETLQKQVAALSASLSAQSALSQKTAPVKQYNTSKPSSATDKEYLIYLGTGSTYNRDWTDIDSATVSFNPAYYGQIKEVRFEAGLSVVSGEVSARLINKTSGAVYYESVLLHNLSSSSWKTSGVIHLPMPAGTYLVQMKSSSGEKAQLDGARIKIIAR